jgi:hypothetical protein
MHLSSHDVENVKLLQSSSVANIIAHLMSKDYKELKHTAAIVRYDTRGLDIPSTPAESLPTTASFCSTNTCLP